VERTVEAGDGEVGAGVVGAGVDGVVGGGDARQRRGCGGPGRGTTFARSRLVGAKTPWVHFFLRRLTASHEVRVA
jgi:hypothetical protein